MPGGVSSPVRALRGVDSDPLFVTKGEGAKIWDTAGKEYIDLCMSFGPLILGHAHPKVVEAVTTTTQHGTSFGISTELEVELAEKIVEAHPGVDWVRFVNSGTEGVMSALRLARGITNRDLIIKFKGCYHGHVDSMLVKSGSGLATFGISSSAGVPADVSKNTIVLNLGNLEEVVEAFAKYPEQVAAIIVEGIPANNGLLIQTKDYMQGLQHLANKHGAMFIVDEVITGFRLGWGGATDYYDLSPDLVVMGKVVGGGFPMALYGGKEEYMQFIAPLGNVYQAGTLSGNPVAMAAGLATLEELSQSNAYSRLQVLGETVITNLQNLFKEHNLPVSIRSVGSIFWIIFGENLSPTDPDEVSEVMVAKYKEFHKRAMQEGVYLPPSAFEVAFLSLAHEPVVDELIERLRKAIK